jgi:hypothetical protein
MKTPSLVPVVVSVDEAHVERIADVATRLAAAGMVVDAVLEATGTITGRAPGGSLSDLAGVDGVEAVELARKSRATPSRIP